MPKLLRNVALSLSFSLRTRFDMRKFLPCTRRWRLAVPTTLPFRRRRLGSQGCGHRLFPPRPPSLNLIAVGQPLPRFEPCLSRPAKQPLTGLGWIHKIKHDDFRIIALRDSAGVWLITPNGFNFADRFSFAVTGIAALMRRTTATRSLWLAVFVMSYDA
jgi:hypothetical protein